MLLKIIGSKVVNVVAPVTPLGALFHEELYADCEAELVQDVEIIRYTTLVVILAAIGSRGIEGEYTALMVIRCSYNVEERLLSL